MICCLCGRTFEEGDLLVQVRSFLVMLDPRSGERIRTHQPMEDGSTEKLACLICPVQYGAPLALVGADLAGGSHV